MARDLGRLVLLGLTGALVAAAFTTYRIWDQGNRDERRQADAIVVMGAAQYDGRPSPVFEARLAHAVALFQDGYAPILIVTGGKQEGDRTTEAAVARRYALQHDVPEAAILAEDRGRTTLESLSTVGEMLRARELKTALFVSDPSHMLRVLRIAHDEDIVAWGSPTPTGPNHDRLDRRIDAMTHELGALGLYFVAGFQTQDAALTRDQ
jgi:uncharacterized SAM-binding protein YcdF (DUF218 family)